MIIKSYMFSSQAAQLRSLQKDNLIVSQLIYDFQELCIEMLPKKISYQYQTWAKFFAECSYFLVTKGQNIKTLGEEYCDLLVVEQLNQYWFLLQLRNELFYLL